MSFNLEQLDANKRPLPTCTCVICGYQFDCASRPNNNQEGRPRPGDFSLCLKCGEIYVFKDDMTIRLPTVAELMNLDQGNMNTLQVIQTKIRKERPLG